MHGHLQLTSKFFHSARMQSLAGSALLGRLAASKEDALVDCDDVTCWLG